MKILLRVLQEGSKAYDSDIKEKLITAAKKLIDREKQKELEDLFEGLFPTLPKKGNETVSGMNEPKKIVFPITNVFLVKKSKKFKINVTFFRKLLSILYNHRLRNNILRR